MRIRIFVSRNLRDYRARQKRKGDRNYKHFSHKHFCLYGLRTVMILSGV
jgi:hypothetical protein